MCHVCNKVYCQGSTLSKHLKTRHNFEWPSGHSRFRYKLESDGYYRLQTLRYESVELVEELNKTAQQMSNQTIQSSTSNQMTNETNTKSLLNQEITSSFLSENNSNLAAPTSSNSLLESANSNTLNDLTNTQNMPFSFSNLMNFSIAETIQIDPANQSNSSCLEMMSSNSGAYHQLTNLERNTYTAEYSNKQKQDEEDESDTEDGMNAEQGVINENYILDLTNGQRQPIDSNTRIEFDLENFLNSNFRVKQQSLEENIYYNNIQHENKQENVFEYI